MDPLLASLASQVATHRVLRVADAAVQIDGEGGPEWCDALSTGERPLIYAVGDEVLVCCVPGRDRSVILGRIGGSRASTPPTEDRVVIEARTELTLRCGAGAITVKQDGKILITGTDLVSHAKNLNRIKGGSVAIN